MFGEVVSTPSRSQNFQHAISDIPRTANNSKMEEAWKDIRNSRLKVIDLSTFYEPGGKQKLAEDLRDAVSY
jgi:hypothetical protein